MYAAKILADSFCGTRLTTFEVTYPRFVHSECLTHRQFSRNSSSSRAIPIEKMIAQVVENPVVPVFWGKNQKGMQSEVAMTPEEQVSAQVLWLDARDKAVESARFLQASGLHKQLVNRVIEPWMWITVILSATEFENFFHLRCHKDAQPEIRKIAEMMQLLYQSSKPRLLKAGEWHLPLLQPEDEDLTQDQKLKVCTGRCARVSYLTHDGKRDPEADITLHDRLLMSGHWSPFEHCAVATIDDSFYGNFKGWKQYRKFFLNECFEQGREKEEGDVG